MRYVENETQEKAQDRTIDPIDVEFVMVGETPDGPAEAPAGLTMVAGDAAPMCEGDACLVPWMRNEDAG